MAQADQTVQNDTFPTVRADINSNLAALFSNNSGASAPSVTVAYMDWIDTSGANPVWKKRNAANNAWITIATIVSNTIEFSQEDVLPDQSGNAGEYLTTDGTVASWAPIPAGTDAQVFTSSGTWTKPSGVSVVYVELWGAGGGGGRGGTIGGGGGGAFRWGFLKAADLAASVSVTVGAGGAGRSTNGQGSDGGSSEFAGLFAGGGGGGYSSGAGGGWRTSASFEAGTLTNVPGGGYLEFGTGATASTDQPLWVGAAGGYGGQNGGGNVYGGAGGGGRNSSTVRTGGNSVFGGDGGDGGGSGTGGNGVAPGGGGGASVTTSGDGARGEVRIYSW